MNVLFHKKLSGYFASKPLYLDEPTQKKPNTRKLVEQPWQQTKGEMWDEVTETLCNLDFIQAKAAAKMTYKLVNDFNAALEVIPDNQENIEAKKARQARMDRYTKDLILYSKGEIKELEIPESITPWSEDRIEEEIERIRRTPDNADMLKDFSYFIGSKTAIFQKYASEFPHHIYQQAWHYANDGPVGKSAEKISPEIKKTLLLCDQNSRPEWNPLPFALKIIPYRELKLSIAITPDGKQAIMGCDKSCIHWDLTTGQVIKKMKGEWSKTKVLYGEIWDYRHLEGHYGSNKALTVTPDGKLAFTGSNEKACLLWDVSSGKVIQTLSGHSASINAVSITPDGSWAISGSDDKTCIVWDLKTGCNPKILEGHSTKVISVSISADGKLALSVSDQYQDKPIIWDIEKGEKLRILDTKSESIVDRIKSVYLTPDGKLALCFGNKHLTYFDLTNGEILQTIKGFKWDDGLINTISITHDGKRALTASNNNNCVLWDLTTGNKLLTLSEHKSSVWAVSITADGRYGISCSIDDTIILWDLEKGKTIKESNHQKSSPFFISITPDGELALFGSLDSNMNSSCTLMNLNKQIVLHEIFATPNHTNFFLSTIYHFSINTLAITQNGQRGISGIDNHTTASSHAEVVNSINVYDLLKGNIIQNLSGHVGKIKRVFITEDGRSAISSSEDESCILWDLVTGEILKTFIGHGFDTKKLFSGQRQFVDEICLVPDGKLVIFSTTLAGCRIWNLPTGETIPIIPPLVKAISTTPDGKWVLSIQSILFNSANDSLVVWNLKTGKEHKVIKHYSKSLSSVSVCPDGKRAITVSGDGTCFLCDIENGKIIADHISTFGIYSVKYLPKGIFFTNQYDEFGFLHTDKKIVCPGIAVTTIKQLWDFELNNFSEPLVYCPLCGQCFYPPKTIIKIIIDILHANNIQTDQSPCLELPDETWEHPGLLGECPSCHEPLKFNPFFGSDQRDIEAYYSEYTKVNEWQIILDDAESAFNEADWDKAFKLFLSLIQAEKFDVSYLRFKMALCRINGIVIYTPEIVANIKVIKRLLQEAGENERVQQINDKLRERLEAIYKAKKPWWKKLF